MPPFDMAAYADIRDRLEAVGVREDNLTPNERELFHTLQTKYREPQAVAFDDVLCLDVMLRNIEIRRGHGMAPAEASGRIFELERRKGDPDDGG